MQAGKTFKCVSFLLWLNCKYIEIMHLCLCRLLIRTVIVLKWTCYWLWKCSIRYLPVVHVLIVAIVKMQYNTLNILQVSSITCSVRCVYVMALAFSNSRFNTSVHILILKHGVAGILIIIQVLKWHNKQFQLQSMNRNHTSVFFSTINKQARQIDKNRLFSYVSTRYQTITIKQDRWYLVLNRDKLTHTFRKVNIC